MPSLRLSRLRRRVPLAIGTALFFWITYQQVSHVGQLARLSYHIYNGDHDAPPSILLFHHVDTNNIGPVEAEVDVPMPKNDTTAAFSHLRHHQQEKGITNTTLWENTHNSSTMHSPYHQVQLTYNEAFMWKGRQRQLCRRIRKEKAKFVLSSTTTNPTTNASSTARRMVLELELPCQRLHQQHQHGNLVIGLYAMHVAAMAHDADLLFTCQQTGEEEEDGANYRQPTYENLFWWLQSLPHSIGYKRQLLRPPQRQGLHYIHDDDPSVQQPTPAAACEGMGKIPLQYASKLASYDLRRMALSLFGARTAMMRQFVQQYPNEPLLPLIPISSRTGTSHNNMNTNSTTSHPPHTHKNESFPLPLQQYPLYPDMELDSVAIHFRCGDVLANISAKQNVNYGFVPFSVYQSILSEWLLEEEVIETQKTSSTMPSIGIITAPFANPRHLRQQDARHARQCQTLVEQLREYLQMHFPQTTVTIRNDPTDTIPMVLARLVLADQVSICIRSTFCVFPTLASFAQTRVFLEGGVSYFVSNINAAAAAQQDTRRRQDEQILLGQLLPTLINKNTEVLLLEEEEVGDGGGHLHLLDSNRTPYLYSHEIAQLGWNATLEWLMTHKSTTTDDP